MTKDEFAALEQKVNAQAIEYVQQGKSIRIREQIWLSLWEMRSILFGTKKIRGYRNFPPSSLYETGEEFLTEVFLKSVPQALDSYAKTNADMPQPRPFMKYFEVCFVGKVYDAYGNIQDNALHDFIVVREPTVQVYQEPREDALIPGTFLRRGMERRILGQISDGKQDWIKTKIKNHGQTVYVKKAEVECCDRASVVNMDDVAEPEAPGRPDDQIMLSNIYEEYILTLLSLVEQLYSRTQAPSDNGLNKKYCFKLLYTETLLDKIKQIYDAIGDVRTAREKDAISVAEAELLDYLLTREKCRTFPSIAVTPLHAKKDFKYLKTESPEEIRIPVANIIYAHFLLDIKGIGRKLDSVPPSISKYRAEFNQQYAKICGADTKESLNN